MASKSYSAFTFARGGSKGVPSKNIHPVAGKPLIAHTIHTALTSSFINRLIVSTDDPRIADIAREYGAEVLMRPAELATDSAPELLAWRHAINSFPNLFGGHESQPFISLPATSPLRTAEDVYSAIETFQRTGADIVYGITPCHTHPMFSMVTIGEDGWLKLAQSGSSAVRRQDLPMMYDLTGCVHVARASHIMNCQRLLEAKAGYVLIPRQRALDIDTPFDIHLADLLLKHPYDHTRTHQN